MKKLLILVFLLAAFTIATADEKSCPADRAAQLGHDPFGAFHEIMAPAWHVAWPDSNFEALFEAGTAWVENGTVQENSAVKGFFSTRNRSATGSVTSLWPAAWTAAQAVQESPADFRNC